MFTIVASTNAMKLPSTATASTALGVETRRRDRGPGPTACLSLTFTVTIARRPDASCTSHDARWLVYTVCEPSRAME